MNIYDEMNGLGYDDLDSGPDYCEHCGEHIGTVTVAIPCGPNETTDLALSAATMYLLILLASI
jgi:uncharacterized protein (UPF0212 family)